MRSEVGHGAYAFRVTSMRSRECYVFELATFSA